MFSIKEEIELQKSKEGPKIKPPRPLDHPVNAEQHTPVYKMHRYYARRPWNVFEHIIKHYTEAGEIILDPFCGGGVTVVEGLKLRRKVIGVDLNPLATFITEMEATPLDVELFKKVFEEVKQKAEKEILPLYKTKCSKCGDKDVYAEWYEWSNVFECFFCHKEVIVSEAEKPSAGVYTCTHSKCQQNFKPSETKKTREVLLHVYIKCEKCGFEGIQKAIKDDIKLYTKIEKDFKEIIKKEKLWYPKDEFPDGDRERDDALSQKGIKKFYQLFTIRNLLANSRLIKLISKTSKDPVLNKFLFLCFSGSLRFSNRMVFRSAGWQAGKPIEWAGHAYWIPDISCELNVFNAFVNRFNSIVRGKEFTNKIIGDFANEDPNLDSTKVDKTFSLLTQSSHNIPIESKSIDAIITDPPFGGNVQYAELSDFWIVWLRDVLKTDGIIDNEFEAIQTRHSGFETAKDETHYEQMLYKIFKECHRVLKPNGYMVLTFHNKDINVWMSLHRAANKAGFRLPTEEIAQNKGIIYQPPIKNYTQTFHTKATGSMLGDFILSFKKMDIVDDEHKIKASLTPEQERKLIDKISSLIQYHGGADENTLMTVLVPFLMNDLHVFTDVASFSFEGFLKKYFEQESKTKIWYTKEQFQEYYDPNKKRLRPIDFVKAEEFTRELIVNFLRQKQYANVDELLTLIYTNLVNSHRPGIQAVQKVLDKFCEQIEDPKTKKKVFRLKKDSRELKEISKPKIKTQFDLFGEESIEGNLEHNQTIELLAHFAAELGFKVHIGKTEQRKEKRFREFCVDMLFKEDYGISSQKAFNKIKEIDLLLIDGKEIPAAFEVTTSIDTAREAINDRFRDLFTILPNTRIKTFIVVKNEDYTKAYEMLNSEANKKDKLNKKITIIKMNKLNKDNFKEWLEK